MLGDRFLGEAAGWAGDGHRSEKVAAVAEDGGGETCDLRVALAARAEPAAGANLVGERVMIAVKDEHHAAGRSAVQRKRVADACRMANRLAKIVPEQANPAIALTHIESRALAGALGQLGQHRLDDRSRPEGRLVQGAKPNELGAEVPARILVAQEH